MSDVRRWNDVMHSEGILPLLRLKEFRNLYVHRLRAGNRLGFVIGRLLTTVYRPEATLRIVTQDIGPGLFIQHGTATVIGAQRVGANCWVNQQVTIGVRMGSGRPTLEDGVTVSAGAKVLGPVTLGAGCTVGANAVVIKDVPADHIAVGVPARHLAKRPA